MTNRLVMIFFIIFAILGFLGLLNASLANLASFLLIISSGIGAWLASTASSRPTPPISPEEREREARKLRASRERERAFYEMTSTLSGTLNHDRVLMTVLDLGSLITRHQNIDQRIISAALLLKDNRLYVASSRGLSRHDSEVILAGKEGILGLALKQTDPVFGGLAHRDPELSYIAALHDCRSVLAMPLRTTYEQYGVLIFGCTTEDAFSEDYVDVLKAISTQATIALQNANLYQTVLSEKERIVEVDEEARKKLARDLHDGPTQVVAAIAMRINYVRRLIQNQNEQAFAELGKVEELARRTTKEIRHMLFTLRPLVLENQGLAAALEQLAEKMWDNYDQKVTVEVQQGIERWLDHNQQGTVFYIVEEAVTNARKHAQAQNIWVRLYQREGLVWTEIEDNGVGFESDALEAGVNRNSLGMVNLRERTDLLPGKLDVASQVGKGTKISVSVEAKEHARPAPPPPSSNPDTPARSPSASQIKRIASARLEAKPQIENAKKLSPSD